MSSTSETVKASKLIPGVDLPPTPEAELQDLVGQVKSLNAEIRTVIEVLYSLDKAVDHSSVEGRAASHLETMLFALLGEVRLCIADEITESNLLEKIGVTNSDYIKTYGYTSEEAATREAAVRNSATAELFIRNLLDDLRYLIPEAELRIKLTAAGIDPTFLATLSQADLYQYLMQLKDSNLVAHLEYRRAIDKSDNLTSEDQEIIAIVLPIMLRFQKLVTAIIQSQQDDKHKKVLLYNIHMPADPTGIRTWNDQPVAVIQYIVDNEWLDGISYELMQEKTDTE